MTVRSDQSPRDGVPVDALPETQGVRFRLVGTVAGTEVARPIGWKPLVVGRSRGCDLTLNDEGVSRRHASLCTVVGGVLVEDLGTKNGTWVDGTRVTRALAQLGSRIELGSVALRIEGLLAADAELAIALDPASQASPQDADEPSTFVLSAVDQGPGDQVLELAEALGDQLLVEGRGGVNVALATLASGLEASWAVLLGKGSGEPRVLGMAGRPQSKGLKELLASCFEDPAGRGGWSLRRGVGDGGEMVSVVVDRLSEGGTVLAVCRERPFRGAEWSLSRLFLRLVASRSRGERASTIAEGGGPAQTLAFPAGYVTGVSPSSRELERRLLSLAGGDLPVLIQGETGVGKEMVARILHASSQRRDRPFVAINCAAIPAELLEAELFGIGRGVATGVEAREGRLEAASGGTLLLDEIGDMPASLQAKLLRVLEEGEIQPLGKRARPIDLRVLSATNQDLRGLANDGRFRSDLFYRLAAAVVEVPPLRERPADIPLFVESFLAAEVAAVGKSILGLSLQALHVLSEYPWPGNVRELYNEVRRLVQVCPPGRAIDSSHLAEHLVAGALAAEVRPDVGEGTLLLSEHTARLEKRLIERALDLHGGNRSRAATDLGVSRNGLALKMRRLGIER